MVVESPPSAGTAPHQESCTGFVCSSCEVLSKCNASGYLSEDPKLPDGTQYDSVFRARAVSFMQGLWKGTVWPLSVLENQGI